MRPAVAENVLLRAAGAPDFASARDLHQRALTDAVRAYERGQREAAESHLRSALQIGGNGREAHAAVAESLIERGRPAEAAALLERALSVSALSDDPLLWALLARAAEQVGDNVRADEARREARVRAESVVTNDAGTGLRRSDAERDAAVRRLRQAARIITRSATRRAPCRPGAPLWSWHPMTRIC
jgi:predicted Zn-dependent protease